MRRAPAVAGAGEDAPPPPPPPCPDSLPAPPPPPQGSSDPRAGVPGCWPAPDPADPDRLSRLAAGQAVAPPAPPPGAAREDAGDAWSTWGRAGDESVGSPAATGSPDGVVGAVSRMLRTPDAPSSLHWREQKSATSARWRAHTVHWEAPSAPFGGRGWGLGGKG